MPASNPDASFIAQARQSRENPADLSMRFAAFLLRMVEEFPVSGRYLGEEMARHAVALVNAVMKEDWQASSARFVSGSGTNPVKSQTAHFGPETGRILSQIRIYLAVSRDAGYISRVIHHISNDVVRELEGFTSTQELFLDKPDLAKEPVVVDKTVNMRNEEVPHNEEHRKEEVPHQNQLPKTFVQPIKDREAAILMLIKEKNPRRFKELKDHFAVSGRALRKTLARLVASGKIMRQGQPPQSWYELAG